MERNSFYRFGIKAFHSFKLNLVRFTDCAFMFDLDNTLLDSASRLVDFQTDL